MANWDYLAEALKDISRMWSEKTMYDYREKREEARKNREMQAEAKLRSDAMKEEIAARAASEKDLMNQRADVEMEHAQKLKDWTVKHDSFLMSDQYQQKFESGMASGDPYTKLATLGTWNALNRLRAADPTKPLDKADAHLLQLLGQEDPIAGAQIAGLLKEREQIQQTYDLHRAMIKQYEAYAAAAAGRGKGGIDANDMTLWIGRGASLRQEIADVLGNKDYQLVSRKLGQIKTSNPMPPGMDPREYEEQMLAMVAESGPQFPPLINEYLVNTKNMMDNSAQLKKIDALVSSAWGTMVGEPKGKEAPKEEPIEEEVPEYMKPETKEEGPVQLSLIEKHLHGRKASETQEQYEARIEGVRKKKEKVVQRKKQQKAAIAGVGHYHDIKSPEDYKKKRDSGLIKENDVLRRWDGEVMILRKNKHGQLVPEPFEGIKEKEE